MPTPHPPPHPSFLLLEAVAVLFYYPSFGMGPQDLGRLAPLPTIKLKPSIMVLFPCPGLV